MDHYVTHYDNNGNRITAVICCRIDITESRSLFYSARTGFCRRYFSTIISICIEEKITTVYYLDKSYITIEQYHMYSKHMQEHGELSFER